MDNNKLEIISNIFKDKEIMIKRKITIGDILILGVLFVISFACLDAVIEEGLDTNVGVLIVGLLFGILFLLIFPYCTFIRPYFKVNSKGVYAKIPKGFSYGKEQFYSWNRIVETINQHILINGYESELVELNNQFVERYINALKQYMGKYDKNSIGMGFDDNYLGLE